MTTIATEAEVKSKLSPLQDAVSAVVTADKAWLGALETFFEGLKPDDKAINKIVEVVKATLPGTLQKIEPDPVLSIDQAVRLVLDEVSFLQFVDKKLEGRVSRADPTSQGLGKAVVEAEAYLVMTDEAFELLKEICTGKDRKDQPLGPGIKGIEDTQGLDNGFKTTLKGLRQTAEATRNGGTVQGQTVDGLASQVGTLLGLQSPLKLPPTEPEGIELLLGTQLDSCSESFLALLPARSKEFNRTVDLLEGRRFALTNTQISALIRSWEKAVTDFVKQSSPEDPVQGIVQEETAGLDTITKFLCIHNVLETLYDRLETNVTRTDVDILSPEI